MNKPQKPTKKKKKNTKNKQKNKNTPPIKSSVNIPQQ